MARLRTLPLASRLGIAIAILVALLVALLGAALYAAATLHHTARDRFVRDAIPLRADARDLATALVNEETGVRGYIITARPTSLEPYRRGRREAAATLAALQAELARYSHPEELALLRRAERQVAQLHRFFAGEIALVGRGPAGQRQAAARVLAGKRKFDGFRATVDAMVRNTDVYVQRAAASQRRTFAWTVAVLLGLGAVGILIGLGLYRRVPRGVARAERRFRTAFDDAPIGMAFKAPDGRWLEVNPALAALTGYAQADLVARGWDGITVPEDLAATREADDRVRRGEARTARVEQRYRHRDGHVIWVETSIAMAREDQRDTFLIAHVQDITARKERDLERVRHAAELERANAELARSNAELEQFASVASHDLSEPLRTISGFAQLLERRYRGRLDGDADEFLQHMVDGASRMQRLIDDLLVVSRAGRAELRREAVDMRELARLTLATLAPRIDETHAAVEVDPALPVVTGDSTQLGQLLQNLVTNALKFSHGEPHVEITAARENGHWRFSVTDDGIGVDPRHAERIFKLFRRLHGRDEYPGTGIGLSVCQRIVERHGGRIWVEPRPEGGSRFSFTLPAEREAVHRG